MFIKAITWTRLALAMLLLSLLVLAPTPARSDQGSLCMPTTGTVSGLTFSQNVNAALQALVTSNSGATAPINPCSGVQAIGQFWYNTGTGDLSIWDGTSWLPLGNVDTATHIWTPPVGGGANTLASASTADLWSIPQSFVTISGTTTITRLAVNGSGVTGSLKAVKFSGALQLTYNATAMILPGGVNITTQAGDQGIAVNLGGGNSALIAYTRADGSALTSGAFSSQVAFSGIITPTAISGTTNNWNPSGLSAASVIRVDPSSTATLTGITAQTDGTTLFLQNVDTAISITLDNESASSTSTNRFALAADYVIGPEQAAIIRYDGTLGRWVIAGAMMTQASQAQAEAGTDNVTVMTPLRTAEAITAQLPSGYLFSSRRTFTSSTTYTPSANVRYVFIRAVAAGGGGGGANCGDTDSATGGGGGGSGEYFEGGATISALDAAGFNNGVMTFTIGAAGSAGSSSGGSGGSGGDTIITSLLNLDGGSGGGGDSTTGYGGSNGGVGGSGGSTVSPFSGNRFVGNGGGAGMGFDGGAGNPAIGGHGGGSQFGGGARGQFNMFNFDDDGEAAGSRGAGGGGGLCASVNAGAAGGAGGAGLILVDEYL